MHVSDCFLLEVASLTSCTCQSCTCQPLLPSEVVVSSIHHITRMSANWLFMKPTCLSSERACTNYLSLTTSSWSFSRSPARRGQCLVPAVIAASTAAAAALLLAAYPPAAHPHGCDVSTATAAVVPKHQNCLQPGMPPDLQHEFTCRTCMRSLSQRASAIACLARASSGLPRRALLSGWLWDRE